MKKTLFTAWFALLLCFVLPLASLYRQEAPLPVPSAGPAPPVPSPPPRPETVRLWTGEELLELDMQDYLTGVLAAEMPASFPEEALKAQAVAARTYTLYRSAAGRHGEQGADVCSDPGCCQAWQGAADRLVKWGENAEKYEQKLRAAVTDTAGQILTWNGQPVFAAFHSSSAGATEDCGAVWSPLPYLLSVKSPEDAESVPDYITYLRCAPLDFRDTVLSAHPEADFSAPEESWIGPCSLDGSGRVATLSLGGAELSGTELRRLFSLRSTAFSLEYRDGQFLFTVTGSGHGVGMSQYGAKVMAEEGADYVRILTHYYPGTLLTS